MRKRTDSSGLGSLGSAALTATSLLVVTGASAIAGVIIALEFGRTDETDGFFAAYGVFIVVVLAAQAIRVAVLPPLARARADKRLAAELAGYAIALAVVAVPIVVLAEVGASPISWLLTGGGSEAAQETAATTLRWMVPAAAMHLFAGVAASGLAALDDYATAALGYAAGSVLGIALILERVDQDGITAVAWGMTLNAAVALAVPLAGLAVRARSARMPVGALDHSGPPIRSRLSAFATASTLPLALQLMYVICLPFAAQEGVGAQTSFAYAYIGSAALVAVTASSLGLVTSVPLTRVGPDPVARARHVVSTSWLAFVAIGAVCGVFAVVGARLVEIVLGDTYGGDIGTEVARLVLAFSPWIAVSVGVTVAFPLTFVVGRTRALPVIGGGALALQVVLASTVGVAFGLYALALTVGASAAAVLGGLLWKLGILRPTARGLATAAAVVVLITAVAYVPPAVVLGSSTAAVVGLVVYGGLLGAFRPNGLRMSWSYLRSLQ